MIRAEQPRAGRQSPSRAALERDAALHRVSRTRRWLILAAGALSAAFAALVSAITPGHSLGAKAQAQTVATEASATTHAVASSNASAAKMPPLASPADLGLQGPSQAPQPSSDPNQVAQSQAAPVPDPSQSAAAVANPAAVAPAPAPAPAVVSGGS